MSEKQKPKKLVNCCYNCPDRRVTDNYNCRSHCERFRARQEKHQQAKKAAEDGRKAKQYMIERTIKIMDVKRKTRKGRY